MSVIAEAKNVKCLHECDSFFKNFGLKDYSLSYMGALDILITFKFKEMAESLMANGEKWNIHFCSLSWWNEDYIPSHCLAWIIIRGVPPYLCDAETFYLIGNSFGILAQESSLSIADRCRSLDRIGILTTQLNKIHDSINIRWRNKYFKVMVEEETSPWIPNFLLPQNLEVKQSCTNGTSKPSEHIPINIDPSLSPTHTQPPHISDTTTSNNIISSNPSTPSVLNIPVIGTTSPTFLKTRKRQRVTSPTSLNLSFGPFPSVPTHKLILWSKFYKHLKPNPILFQSHFSP